MNTRTAAVLLILFLGLALAACAQADPAPPATIAPTQSPTATASPRPTLTPTPTPTPTPKPELRPLTTGGCCVQPSWSPDSRQVLFIDKPSAGDPAGIYAVDILTGANKPPRMIGRIGIYSADRSLVAYPGNSGTIVERPATGDQWTLGSAGQVTFAPDNLRLAWTDDPDTTSPYDRRRSDIYVANLDGTGATRIARVYGGGLAGWLPGGSRIMVQGRPSLDVQDRTLAVFDLATGTATNLVTAGRISGVSASSDGTWVAYYIAFDKDTSRSGIWVQRTDGSGARKLDLWGAYQWRDDSHLLAIPMRKPGEAAFEVWEVDAASGASRKLTDASTTPLQVLNGDWRVSPDGRYVVYVNSADRNLWLLSLPPASGQ